MSAAAAFMGFPLHKVASLMRQLTGFQIVATVSRQFRKTNKLRQGFILYLRIVSTLSTLSTKLIRPAFYAPCTVAGVSFAFLIGANDE
jgi:hypothetical protein